MINEQKTAVALGMFDGVHIGHGALITRTVEIARERAYAPVAYTFSNHPQGVITGETPTLILTDSERVQKLKALGIENVVADEFTTAVLNTEPKEFAAMLYNRLNARAVIVGYNYTFGKNGKGTPELLTVYGKEYGFTTEIIPPVTYMDEPVSSTRIRHLIESGDVKNANVMLNAPFSISGQVCGNKHIGKELGYPTLNITDFYNKPLPRFGVYATVVTIDGESFFAVTNVGNNPTIADNNPTTIESHLFNYDGVAYGKIARVRFIDFLREQQRFVNTDELKKQIAKDAALAKEVLASVCKRGNFLT